MVNSGSISATGWSDAALQSFGISRSVLLMATTKLEVTSLNQALW